MLLYSKREKGDVGGVFGRWGGGFKGVVLCYYMRDGGRKEGRKEVRRRERDSQVGGVKRR